MSRRSSGTAASAAASGSSAIKRSKYGTTALTRVCCSMISETHVRYGVTSLRHGSARPFKSYHASSGAVRAFRFSQCSVIISFVEARGKAAAAAELLCGNSA